MGYCNKSATVFLTSILLSNAMACQMPRNHKTPQRVTIILGQDISSLDWPLYQNGSWQETKLYAEPHDLDVTLPDGRKLSYKVLNTLVYQKRQKVCSIFIRLSDTTTDLEKSIKGLENELIKVFSQIPTHCREEIKDLRVRKPDLNSFARGSEELSCVGTLNSNLETRAGIRHLRGVGLWGVPKPEWIVFLELIDINACL